MKTRLENTTTSRRLLTAASMTRQQTAASRGSRSWVNTLTIILRRHRQHGAETAAQINTADTLVRPRNPADLGTINTPLAVNHLQVFLLRRPVCPPPRIHSATLPEQSFSPPPHTTEETLRQRSSRECQSRKSCWEKSLNWNRMNVSRVAMPKVHERRRFESEWQKQLWLSALALKWHDILKPCWHEGRWIIIFLFEL